MDAPDLPLERSFYIGNIFGGIFYGLQLCITFSSIYFLWSGDQKQRSTSKYYVAYGLVMLLCMTFAMSTNALLGQMMWVEHRDFPGGPPAWFAANSSVWYSVMGSAFDAFADLLGDALLLYRCYIVWNFNLAVITIPGMMLLASVALSIMTVVESALPGSNFFAKQTTNFAIPWISLTCSLNFLLTILIASRLLWLRRSLNNAMGRDISSLHSGLVAILVESAAPFTVLGIILAVLLGKGNEVSIYFTLVWGYYVGIAPQLIILRIAMGHSFTKETFTKLTLNDSFEERTRVGNSDSRMDASSSSSLKKESYEV